MACRKQIVKNRNELASLQAMLEGGKSEAKVGDHRQSLRLLKQLEKWLIVKGYKSAVMMIRREAREEVKAMSEMQKSRLRKKGVV